MGLRRGESLSRLLHLLVSELENRELEVGFRRTGHGIEDTLKTNLGFFRVMRLLVGNPQVDGQAGILGRVGQSLLENTGRILITAAVEIKTPEHFPQTRQGRV